MISLSPIQALKLETLAQAKVSEDLLKSHNVDKELITLAEDVLGKILQSFKLDITDTPSGKLRSMLNAVYSHFVSLEKVIDARVLSQFNAMRLKTFVKMIEGYRVSLIIAMKTIQDALDDGG